MRFAEQLVNPWHTRIALWLTFATHTHHGYTHINTNPFVTHKSCLAWTRIFGCDSVLPWQGANAMETNARIRRPAMVRNTRKRPCEFVWWLIKRTNDCVQRNALDTWIFFYPYVLFAPSLYFYFIPLSLLLSLSCCRLIPFWVGQLLRPAGFKLDLQHHSGTLLVLAALSQGPLSGFLSGLATHGVWLFNQIICTN